MMNLTVVLSAWVCTLQQFMLAACNAAFPVGKVDNLFTTEVHLRALPAQIRAMVTEAVRQGATMTLATAQLQIGTAVNLGVTEQGFPSRSMDDDITDLIESFKLATNAILPKVDMELILHANLDP